MQNSARNVLDKLVSWLASDFSVKFTCYLWFSFKNSTTWFLQHLPPSKIKQKENYIELSIYFILYYCSYLGCYRLDNILVKYTLAIIRCPLFWLIGDICWLCDFVPVIPVSVHSCKTSAFELALDIQILVFTKTKLLFFCKQFFKID